jgi:hypothetical protein
MERTKFNPQQIAEHEDAGFEIAADGKSAKLTGTCTITVTRAPGDGEMWFETLLPNGQTLVTIGYDLPDVAQQAVENRHILSNK